MGIAPIFQVCHFYRHCLTMVFSSRQCKGCDRGTVQRQHARNKRCTFGCCACPQDVNGGVLLIDNSRCWKTCFESYWLVRQVFSHRGRQDSGCKHASKGHPRVWSMWFWHQEHRCYTSKTLQIHCRGSKVVAQDPQATSHCTAGNCCS